MRVSSFDNKEQCDACGGFFHERSMTFEDNALCVTCCDESIEENRKMDDKTIEGLQKIRKSLELEAKEARLFGHKDIWTLARRHIKMIDELSFQLIEDTDEN
jgi:hypothetical protein